MKKILITMLTAMLAVMMLSGCGAKDTTEEIPDDVNETETEELVEDETASEEEAQEGQPDSPYEVGKEYVLRDDMKVRKGPSTDEDWIKTADLADEDKDKALDGDDAVLKKGSTVKCIDADGNWIKIASGWICGSEKGRVYIIVAEYADRFEASKNAFYEKVGVDRGSSKKLSGTYSIDSSDGEDSVELFEDGECAMHFDQPMTPMTDEEGYTSGFYAVSGSKVYINCGGSVYADVYEMSGNTLTKTSEQIELYQG